MLNWANRFNICCFLDNHQYNIPGNKYECIVGAGMIHQLQCSAGIAFHELREFHGRHADWLFGHLSYDLKNEIESLESSLPDHVGFPDLYFFIPEVICFLSPDEIRIGSFNNDHEAILNEINNIDLTVMPKRNSGLKVNSRFDREEYCRSVNLLREHILRGDCYEINFCQEFFIEGISIDPLDVFTRLDKTSPNPFAAFYKLNSAYCLCASPERYLKKEGQELTSQPIKGTILRGNDEMADAANIRSLLESEKERSENVMVVDLVRNDLSRVCTEGSVMVKELFGIYSFPQVHQMISTVSGQLQGEFDFVDAIKASFPMGSMTGAPKKRVMELIEQYERTRRGIFSGAIGYIDPETNMDLNVVIRSIMYNGETGYLSYQAGSAITYGSDSEKEYEECLLKSSAIKKVLTN